MSQIQISLEGASAIAFAEALRGLPGFDVSYAVADSTEVGRGEKLDRVLITLTTVVALATSTVELADKAIGLAEHLRDFQAGPVNSALVVSDQGDRQLLENATMEQVLETIRSLKK
jgi:hypothetical protein